MRQRASGLLGRTRNEPDQVGIIGCIAPEASGRRPKVRGHLLASCSHSARWVERPGELADRRRRAHLRSARIESGLVAGRPEQPVWDEIWAAEPS